MLVRIYSCQNTTLLENTCHGLYHKNSNKQITPYTIVVQQTMNLQRQNPQ